MRIRPAARDQLAMPAQECRRRHKRRPLPHPTWQHPTERSQQRPIGFRQLRTSDLTLQYSNLMAQQQDLDLLLPLRPAPKHDQLQQPSQRPVANERTTPRERPATHLTLSARRTRRPQDAATESELSAPTRSGRTTLRFTD